MKFCIECATPLKKRCSQCGFENPPQAKFCGECAALLTGRPPVGTPSPLTPSPPPASYTPQHLADRIRAEQATLEARGSADGERKTITALFADLKGSTALIEGLDPEEARAIIDPALQLMMDAVHRYEGYVAQALGDGIFALFGAPIAHEDHPQRALYAALRMQDEMRRYADTLRAQGYPPLLMRVGVNTGEVVVRSIRKDDLHADYVPVGHSTNLAARMEQLAAPGSILVTAYTHRLTDGYFTFKDLGQTQLKGVKEPLQVYEVLGAGPLRTRLQVSAARRGLTRFVGRQRELEQLQHALDQAKAGHGQIVGVMGEPGLGKSRLFYEFTLLARANGLILEAYSVSYGKASPYLPVIELLKSYFDIQAQDDERKRRERVIGKVLGLDRTLEDTLPYLFSLLGSEEQPSPLQQMDPQIRRRRTLEALTRLFLRESLNQPLVLVFEDLHWIDSETQGFLDTLSEGLASVKLLLLVNYRPEYRHDWGQKTYYTQLRLAPFGRAEAEEFLDLLLADGAGAQQAAPLYALKQLILTKTDGTPFFMEEVVRELVEQGVLRQEAARGWVLTRPATALQIPTTVHGVLAARIDRLAPDEKALVQQLAVIGREFPLSLLTQVIAQPEEELFRLLATLRSKEFLYEQPAFPEVEYLFKHALTQEVAYNSVLLERRKVLHEHTARVLEALRQERLEEYYPELAHHYSRSGNAEKAIDYLHKAGQQATQRAAYAEAITYLTTALERLPALPDSHDRTRREVILQLALGMSLQATKGIGSPEVGQTYERAHALCVEMGHVPELFPILRSLCVVHNIQANLHKGHELARHLLTLAEQEGVAGLLIEAHLAMGANLYWRGEFAAARTHFEEARSLYDPSHHSDHILLYGRDSRMFGLDYWARTMWSLGYPDQALHRAHEMVTWAQELGHAHSLAWALTASLWTRLLRREWRDALDKIEAALTFATDHGFSGWVAYGVVNRRWMLVQQGQLHAGINELQHGLASIRTTGTIVFEPFAHAPLIEAYGKTGQFEMGLQTASEALHFADRYDNRMLEAEVHRLKGEVLLAQEGLRLQSERFREKTEEAEKCFLQAIEVARKQQVKSLELRAVMSLARLWQQQGKKAEAQQLLTEIYGWFTEGFDTKDLQEAKTLLEELS
jgi:class 3 adenylate cyclase/tetratricopeptide (TPR) repeat protein